MSKRIFQHPEESKTGKRYWRSLGQLQDSQEFRNWLHREFPQGASELEGSDVSRRSFLQLMGASVALAGMSLSACRRPVKELVPFTKGTEWSVPGKALFFSSAMPRRGGALPLVVTTFDGRPTKIEGNPMHPSSGGATDTWAQSSVLDLYDPHRSKQVLHAGKAASMADLDAAIGEAIKVAGDGAGLAFLVDGASSPTRERLRKDLLSKYPQAFWATYEPLESGNSFKAASVAFGEGKNVRAKLSAADIVLTVDRDILGTEGDLTLIRDFASRRKVESAEGARKSMNRLYVAENRFTITGGMADHRLRLASASTGAFLKRLADELSGLSKDENLLKAAKQIKVSVNLGAATNAKTDAWVKECAADLWAHKGRSVVLVGEDQPLAVQLLGLAINQTLGSFGRTIEVVARQSSSTAGISELAAELKKGKTNALFILGGNPVYNAPSDVQWLAAQEAVKTVFHLSHEVNETSVRSAWHIPSAHYLEQWGDATARDGSYMVVQPMILPLYGGLSDIELIEKTLGEKGGAQALVQKTFAGLAQGGDLSAKWAKTLKDGKLSGSETGSIQADFQADKVAFEIGESPAISFGEKAGDLELVLARDSKTDDGRYANNGWLQELPDPITKLTWDNAALVSPATCKRIGVKTGDMIKIATSSAAIEIPVLELPGHADDSVTVQVGYGRTEVGQVGKSVGVSAYPLLNSVNSRFIGGISISKTGKKTVLAITQEHGALEGRGADLTREVTVEEWSKNSANPNFIKKMGMDAHAPANFSLYTNPPLDDVHAWGMAVDLNTCIGCAACMVACQAENNIPIVGKEQVIGGREMHWMRTDRYFASEEGQEDDPEMVSQPMMCQHCENAPCETVCPVNATVHSEDGLNVMAYNRCIGTRYCANNCPFKVRRFNFFDYNERSLTSLYRWNLITEKGMPESLKLQKNPNVTVRMRGVMEKCSFCVQRIQEAKITAKVISKDSSEAPRVPADAFTSACAQVCPTGAIVFGDIKNPESKISKLKEDQRGYRLLEYLNTNNRVWYLARLRNPNPRMPDASRAGVAARSAHGNNDHHQNSSPSHTGGHQ